MAQQIVLSGPTFRASVMSFDCKETQKQGGAA